MHSIGQLDYSNTDSSHIHYYTPNWCAEPATEGPNCKNWLKIREIDRFPVQMFILKKYSFTGKSLSEALLFASTNPQYDKPIVH